MSHSAGPGPTVMSATIGSGAANLSMTSMTGDVTLLARPDAESAAAAEPTAAPDPTGAPEPTGTPEPTGAPDPTGAPEPTGAADPTHSATQPGDTR